MIQSRDADGMLHCIGKSETFRDRHFAFTFIGNGWADSARANPLWKAGRPVALNIGDFPCGANDRYLAVIANSAEKILLANPHDFAALYEKMVERRSYVKVE